MSEQQVTVSVLSVDAVVSIEESSGVQVSVPQEVVRVSLGGSIGPAGPPGEQGEPGAPGTGSGDAYYTHSQGVAATTWTVVHNLGKFPAVTVVDSAGTTVEGTVDHIDINTLTINFAVPFSGTAYMN